MMDIPRGGIFVVLGEISSLLTAIKKNNRWSSTSHQDEGNDILMRGLTDLKDVLHQINDLRELDPNHFLSPFLEVIRSEGTTSLITSLALSAVLKFLSYNLIDPKGEYVAVTVNNIANAITHAKFVGTDPNNDAVVLMKILQILRALVMASTGALLTNKCVCDILLSCFRICFEGRLNDILRKFAESTLKDMVQLLFTRLPSFSEESSKSFNVKKLQMRTSSIDSVKSKHKSYSKRKHRKSESKDSQGDIAEVGSPDEVNQPTVLDMQGTIHKEVNPSESQLETDGGEETGPGEDHHEVQQVNCGGVVITMEDSYNEHHLPTQNSLENGPSDPNLSRGYNLVNGVVEEGTVLEKDPSALAEAKDLEPETDSTKETDPLIENKPEPSEPIVPSESHSTIVEMASEDLPNEEEHVTSLTGDDLEGKDDAEKQDIVNQQGVRFTASMEQQDVGQEPYGLVCVQQLLRLLASLCNPLDKQNSIEMLQTGLALVSVSLEVGADSVAKFPSLLEVVKDDLCRSLFSLLNSDRLSIFATDVQVCFLMFESLRVHLKFQFQSFLSKLTDIIVSDNKKIPYEMREISLETVVQLWRIPGLVTELYLNYDCDLFCPNLYEELTNLLSKNAYPLDGVYNTHLLSLDALLTVIDSIESHCHSRILNERQHNVTDVIVDEERAMSEVVDPSTNYILREGARHKTSTEIPSHEQIMAIKRKKKLLSTGTEQFNIKPKKGIEFLQEQRLLSVPLDPEEIVTFLRENPHLDKKMIGDYISTRVNLPVLNSFVKSYDFTDTRIDEALRLYLESFRLPGESLLISLVMEHFAEHWHKCNGEPFASADAAFTLAYAIIMLNVDQHNHNVRRQNIPMTCDDFKRNLKNVNGGQNFDQKLLDDIYESIKSDEIVMPAEQTGSVRENYLWKTMLRRGMSKDGVYIRAPSGLFDHNLFSIIWSPTVTALSSLFDKTNDPTIYQKAISGYRKCAMISAHYGMSNEFDNLIVSLCKFTTLLNSPETADTLTVTFGANAKARLSAKAVFNLAHRHGDIIRDSWGNILECVLQLYRCKLLPKILVEAEDFIELSGKISLMRDEMMSQMSPKTETGIFSSLYSYIALGAEANANKGPSPEDQEAMKLAQNCIRECHLEQLITESKFLRFESLQFFIKALIHASYGPEGHVSLGSSYSEGTAVFFLELLLKVVIQNRDRVGVVWPKIKDHIYTLMMGAAACNHSFLVERCVVGLLRLAIRLMRREEMSPIVLQSLRMLLLLKGTLSRVSRQVSYGMFELLKTSAANIHSAADWAVIFTLLECVGAGAPPPRVLSKPPINESGAKSEGECGEVIQMPERGYTSDSELNKVGSGSSSPDLQHNNTGWILVGKEGEIQAVTGLRIVEDRDLAPHDPFALVKCCESLSFLVRDVAHITPYNFENCVRSIRTFVQAALYITCEKKSNKKHSRDTGRKRGRGRREEAGSGGGGGYDADESDADDAPTGYQQVCIQLMDLMFTLHTRTAQIFRWWAEEEGGIAEHTSLWQCGWCPLLEGISSLCTHPDRQVRMSAITYLQRGLLVSDLSVLTGNEWESCFTRVLFPLLTRMLEPEHNPAVIEESRIRAATVLSKVFLHHLTPLQTLPSFLELWMAILDFMDKYMHADNSDLLYEAVPESLKNMLLVMDSSNLFTNPDGSRNELWALSWDRISSFLPNLQQELFRPPPSPLPSPPPLVVADQSQTKEETETAAAQQNVMEIPQTLPQQIPVQPVISPQPPPQQVIAHEPAACETPSHLSPSHSASGVSDAAGSQSIVTASLVSSTPSNWQPPAPIFPHIGQILSTPIGPVGYSAEDVPSSNVSGAAALPVYSGFANSPPRPAPPSAQFFYQDMPQMQPPVLQQNDLSPSGSILLSANLMNSNVNKISVVSPSESSS